MLKLNIFLTLILVMCALGVVTAQHEARKLFVMLEKEKERARKLNVEWGKLQLELGTLATHRRIEHIAKQTLKMEVPAASRVQIISPSSMIDLTESDGVAKQ